MILDRILAAKAEEVAAARAARPLPEVERAAAAAAAPRGFAAALADGTRRGDGRRVPVAVIAEVKKASPSKGILRPDFDPVAIARAYADGGADALSVLTDAPFFQGSLAHLQAVRAAVALPLLRKDFIIDPYQVYEARAAGADAVLLIVAAFAGGLAPPAAAAGSRTPADLGALCRLAEALGMAALVEVHTAAELAVALGAGARLVGINNRNLHTFHTTLDVTVALAPAVPPEVLLVSESGIGATADLRAVAAAGARAVLVGESLVRQPDPAAAVRALLGVA